jgi:hypothetical protein
MVDMSDLEARLRRLEESHEALARRVESLGGSRGAVQVLEKADDHDMRNLPMALIGTAIVVGLIVAVVELFF